MLEIALKLISRLHILVGAEHPVTTRGTHWDEMQAEQDSGQAELTGMSQQA